MKKDSAFHDVRRSLLFALLTAIPATALILRKAIGASSTGNGSTETEAGNLTADALRSAAGTAFAFVPASCLKTSRYKADADAESYFTSPDDPVAIMSLSGQQVIEALERSVSLSPRSHQGFLQVSGLSFRYDRSQEAGKRISDVRSGKQLVIGSKSYLVAMPKVLASGGLGYFRIWRDAKPEYTSTTLAGALKKYLARNPDPASYSPGNRIKGYPD